MKKLIDKVKVKIAFIRDYVKRKWDGFRYS